MFFTLFSVIALPGKKKERKKDTSYIDFFYSIPNLTDLKLSMNLLPSHSCSSSSSFSTSSFDANACNPRASASPSCLSGILRRILCSGSLPTHPSDHITEETNSVKSDDKLLQVKDVSVLNATNEAKPSAGIVARLMGLDPMPEMKQNHNTIAGSQSMNSVEHFFKHLEGRHKGVKSAVSFREIPTFIELQNENYFILSFEGEAKSKEFEAKESRIKQRNEEKVKFKNRGSNKTEQAEKMKRFNPEAAKEIIVKDLKQKKKARQVEFESSSSSDELISPVSVLERDSTPLSGDASSNRRKLSPDLDDGLIIKEGKSTKTKVIYNGVRPERFEEGICEISEMELLSESNWIKCSKISEELDVGGIIEGFDSYILDGLIEEFVEQMYDSIFF